ncbi:uncharacterized protein LOC120266899 [Dioscorea cayenensis subsp. rotundata]|uniref:Uncharacterized protein LOC120266899 n=1 Tax=Dioscorea cayennensis subsp. rotundata TaxID=55577 RepID=A0AB40BST3_DIOCR|nr:uncharacterized protein LOC120266899 [Dioscorea cayenensis subsp. rotundata]
MEEERSAILCSSANWVVSDGSIEGSISFDTSSSPVADDGPAAIPTGVFLLRPPSMDSIPCEITICFRSKYEIHRVYVRSTARVFEIYYTTDKKDKSNEYLCTVRCGEVTSGDDNQEYVTECQKESNETAASHEKLGQNDDGAGDEDEWIEVKVPHSPQQANETNSLGKMVHTNTKKIKEVFYEATAEIADASPCVTLSLRLLSLKNKACVHVEEIYIYADPVELTDPDNFGNTTGSIERSSLLAMLVPNLLQLSKSGSGRIQDRCSSDVLMAQKPQNSLEKAAESSMIAEMKVPQEINPNAANQKLGMDESGKDKAEITNSFMSSEKYTPVPEQDNLVYNRVEKVLDELVSRVGKIEAFCSRFEENMMKPLNCIETRLQSLEHQFEAFAARMPSSEGLCCSKISAPEFSFDESDSEHNDSNSSHLIEKDNSTLNESSVVDDVPDSLPDSQMSPGLVVKAPEFSSEDNEPGLVVKAPEFSTEDEEQTDNNDTGDTLDSTEKDPPQVKKFLSIEDALTSALKAFLSSTSDRFPPTGPNVTEKQKSSDGENNAVAPIILEGPPEGASCLSGDIDFGKKHCGLSDTVISEETTFDAVLPFVGPEKDHVFDSQMFPSPASYFPTNEDDLINHNETADSELWELRPVSSFSFLISSTEEVPEVSYGKKNVLASSVGMPCEGDKMAGMDNCCTKDMTNDAELPHAANFLHVLFEEPNEPATCEKQSSMGAPAGGSNPNGSLPEVPLEQKEHFLKWQKYSSAAEFDEVFTHPHSFASGSNSSYSSFPDGRWADESDGEENSFQNLGFGQLGRRWTEDSCTDSSIDEVFLKNKLAMGWSDASSAGSLCQLDGCITDDFGSNQATEDSTTIRSILSEPSIGNNHDKLKIETEWNYTLDSEHPVLDVKFPPVRTWITETPLEVLLGESSEPLEQYRDNDDHNLDTQQHDSFSYQDLDRSQSLLDVEDLMQPTEFPGSQDAPHGDQIDNGQPFSSLI